MIKVYSSSMVIRDISSASSGARKSAISMLKAEAISIDSLWEGLTRLIQLPGSSVSISLNSVVVDKKTCFMVPPLVFLHLNIITEKARFWIKEY